MYFRSRIWFSKLWIKLVRWWFFTHTLGKFFKNLDVLVLFCRLLVAWLWALFSPLNQILYKWGWYKSSRFSRQGKKSIILYPLYVKSKKIIQRNLFTNRNRLTDLGNKLMVIKWERRGGINQGFRFNIYTVLYTKQINKDLSYSTGNCI